MCSGPAAGCGFGREGIELLAASVDGQDKQKALSEKLGLGFGLLSADLELFQSQYGVASGKRKGTGYLQPAVFVFSGLDKVFEWLHAPRLLNMGGATGRMAPEDVLQVALDAKSKLQPKPS